MKRWPWIALLLMLLAIQADGNTVSPSGNTGAVNGNTINSNFVINNASGNNNGIDLDLWDAANKGEVIILETLGLGAQKPYAYVSGFNFNTGAYVGIGVVGASSQNTSITCDSIDNGSADAGYCSMFPSAGSLGFKASTFVFNVIYSAAGTAIPAAAAGNAHARACVSDSTLCTSGTTYVSGGSTPCELWSNGTNWIESGSGC